ncbi:cysteine desulfurase family protein [Georgenia faecalis]|uniref:cysteine desulfurase family protein n=1 Tax=Georgenia faecalis TaxID=2483799 RepID=UPI000FD9B50D|nr:cysteine desulfurase family protein [Georgenia faecalis]
MTYLDHAATTAVRPEAAEAFARELARPGNPSSLHAAGRDARRRVEESREAVAAALGAQPGEVVFTSGGTEADNLAVKGTFWSRRAADPVRTRVLVSAVEHPAVLDATDWLADHESADVVRLPVDAAGRLDHAALAAELRAHGERTALVSVMWANNEVGTVQPLPEVVAAARAAGVSVHSDAVQAVGHVPVDFAASGLDAMTVSGHKLGAPIGVGALLARRELALVPVEHGGGQERGVRSGTLSTPAICAFAAAVGAAVAEQEAEAARLAVLRADLVRGVLASVPGARLSGPEDPAAALPQTAHFTFDGCDADALLFGLDMAGVSASSGSACQAGVQEPSHVLLAMGRDLAQARSAVRLTLGWTSTADDVAAVLAALPGVVERARAARTR